MSLSTQESEEDSDYVLVARLDNARIMANILKAIHFKDVCAHLCYALMHIFKIKVIIHG